MCYTFIILCFTKKFFAQYAGAIDYTNGIFPLMSDLDIILNNLMVKLQ